jgi:NADH:ubiquinone oxidoreductase subunit
MFANIASVDNFQDIFIIHIMYITTYLHTYFFGKFVGRDEFGNSYYRNTNAKDANEKRWVIYKGVIEASKVPATWHRWLHYTTDKLPTEEDIESFVWQKSHKANFTGTDSAYKPISSAEIKEHVANSAPYQAWKPN